MLILSRSPFSRACISHRHAFADDLRAHIFNEYSTHTLCPQALAGAALLAFALWVRKPVQRFLARVRTALGKTYTAFIAGGQASPPLSSSFSLSLRVGFP